MGEQIFIAIVIYSVQVDFKFQLFFRPAFFQKEKDFPKLFIQTKGFLFNADLLIFQPG